VETARGQSAWPPDALCNVLGAEGWELCGVAGTDEISNYTLFFNRPKS
jgi:hypothetical protein